MAKTISLKDAPAEYVTAFEQVKETGLPQIIERDGKPFVVVIPFDEYEQLRALREREDDEAWLEQQQQIIRQEQLAFERMKPELLTTHKGKFVAIHNAQLVDFDDDESTLAKRVYARFGYRAILMTEVIETPRVYYSTYRRVIEQ